MLIRNVGMVEAKKLRLGHPLWGKSLCYIEEHRIAYILCVLLFRFSCVWTLIACIIGIYGFFYDIHAFAYRLIRVGLAVAGVCAFFLLIILELTKDSFPDRKRYLEREKTISRQSEQGASKATFEWRLAPEDLSIPLKYRVKKHREVLIRIQSELENIEQMTKEHQWTYERSLPEVMERIYSRLTQLDARIIEIGADLDINSFVCGYWVFMNKTLNWWKLQFSKENGSRKKLRQCQKDIGKYLDRIETAYHKDKALFYAAPTQINRLLGSLEEINELLSTAYQYCEWTGNQKSKTRIQDQKYEERISYLFQILTKCKCTGSERLD